MLAQRRHPFCCEIKPVRKVSVLLKEMIWRYALPHPSIQASTVGMGRVAEQTGKDGCAMVKLGFLFVRGYIIEPYSLEMCG
jgi:hypothetical protein